MKRNKIHKIDQITDNSLQYINR